MKKSGALVLLVALCSGFDSSRLAAAESQSLQKLTIGYPALATP